VIFVALSATKWLRTAEQSLQRMYLSSSWIGVVLGLRTISILRLRSPSLTGEAPVF
jgi:hypothetical protein